MEGENDYIPRICVAKSIEDCLSAMPEGGYKFKEKPRVKWRVYAFNEDAIQQKNILSPVELYFSEWVLDAWVTGEHWIVDKEIQPAQVFDIQLKDFQVIDAPYVTPKKFKEAFEEKGNPAETLDLLEEESNESVARITNLTYEVIHQLV